MVVIWFIAARGRFLGGRLGLLGLLWVLVILVACGLDLCGLV